MGGIVTGLRRAVVPLLGLTLATACGAGSRSFVADDTVRITSPAPLTTVTVPFAISWSAPAGPDRYAVFVDLPPIGPGSSLKSLATQQCKSIPSCWPDPSYLAGLGVYLSGGPTGGGATVQVGQLIALRGVGAREVHPVHLATIVRLDPAGHRRVGDAAWQVEFRA